MSTLLLHKDTAVNKGVGGKAINLLRLEEMGVEVPTWVVIPQEVLLKQLPTHPEREEINRYFQNLTVPPELIAQLAQHFGNDHQTKTFAVRSSAIDEDGSQFSFAGQFETFLHVTFAEIEEKIKAIWRSVVSARVLKYREENNLPLQFGIGVIVQEMITPEVSGVAFGMNPVSGPQTISGMNPYA